MVHPKLRNCRTCGTWKNIFPFPYVMSRATLPPPRPRRGGRGKVSSHVPQGEVSHKLISRSRKLVLVLVLIIVLVVVVVLVHVHIHKKKISKIYKIL